MRSTRSGTFVRARELEPLMVVRDEWYAFGHREADLHVLEVRRAADDLVAAQTKVAKAKSRPQMREATEALTAVLDALDNYGREARIIDGVQLFKDGSARRVLGRVVESQEDFRYVSQVTEAYAELLRGRVEWQS